MYDKNANYAILLADGTVKPCSMQQYFRRRGREVIRVRHDVVRNYSVETAFTGESRVLDGPQLWWSMIVAKRAKLAAGRAKDPSSIEELLASTYSGKFAQPFPTKEEALTAHEAALKLVRREVRRKDKLVQPEHSKMLSETLLGHLDYWCKQGWGRQAEIAHALEVTPQSVNHWLNGRKQMTGEQALQLLWYLVRVNRNLAPLQDLLGADILWSDLSSPITAKSIRSKKSQDEKDNPPTPPSGFGEPRDSADWWKKDESSGGDVPH
jgi:DNA-binding transcriptional regulator YdaS (Cro superfamily)